MIIDLKDLLRRSIGERIQRVVGSFHRDPEGVSTGAALSVWMKFSNVPLFRLFGAPDGWHLDADLRAPETISFGESGSVSIDDLGQSEPFQAVIGHRLDDAQIVCSPGQGDVVGVRLSFEPLDSIVILNWGDELSIGRRYPDDAEPNELIEFAVGSLS